MNQLELLGFQAQAPGCFICVEDYIKKWISWRRIILRNGPVGALRLPGSECLILLMDSIKKWSSWSFVAHSLGMLHFLTGLDSWHVQRQTDGPDIATHAVPKLTSSCQQHCLHFREDPLSMATTFEVADVIKQHL